MTARGGAVEEEVEFVVEGAGSGGSTESGMNMRALRGAMGAVLGWAGRASRSAEGRGARAFVDWEEVRRRASRSRWASWRADGILFPACSQAYFSAFFAFCLSSSALKLSLSSDVYFAWNAERLRFRSTCSCFGAGVELVEESATDRGVSAPLQARGVSSPPPAPTMGVMLVPRHPRTRRPSGPGVMTCVNLRPASAIQALSCDSSASRYSCCVCVSSSPGKKSRAMMWESASV